LDNSLGVAATEAGAIAWPPVDYEDARAWSCALCSVQSEGLPPTAIERVEALDSIPKARLFLAEAAVADREAANQPRARRRGAEAPGGQEGKEGQEGAAAQFYTTFITDLVADDDDGGDDDDDDDNNKDQQYHSAGKGGSEQKEVTQRRVMAQDQNRRVDSEVAAEHQAVLDAKAAAARPSPGIEEPAVLEGGLAELQGYHDSLLQALAAALMRGYVLHPPLHQICLDPHKLTEVSVVEFFHNTSQDVPPAPEHCAPLLGLMAPCVAAAATRIDEGTRRWWAEQAASCPPHQLAAAAMQGLPGALTEAMLGLEVHASLESAIRSLGPPDGPDSPAGAADAPASVPPPALGLSTTREWPSAANPAKSPQRPDDHEARPGEEGAHMIEMARQGASQLSERCVDTLLNTIGGPIAAQALGSHTAGALLWLFAVQCDRAEWLEVPRTALHQALHEVAALVEDMLPCVAPALEDANAVKPAGASSPSGCLEPALALLQSEDFEAALVSTLSTVFPCHTTDAEDGGEAAEVGSGPVLEMEVGTAALSPEGLLVHQFVAGVIREACQAPVKPQELFSNTLFAPLKVPLPFEGNIDLFGACLASR